MVCPVCNTPKVNPESSSCNTCGWYFPLQNTPQFQLELGRAKQHFQMVNSFNQMFQHMQVQSKMLEKISFRLDGLEDEVNAIKENRRPTITVHQDYNYPSLEPIQKVEDFDTPEKRAEWWNALEAQWQKAFKQAVIQKSEYHELTDEDYLYILTSPTVRFVGPRGMHPSIDFELTNLSGLRHLTDLSLLIASHQALTSLKGIEHLKKVTGLFVHGNKLKNIKEVFYLKNLKELNCLVNQLIDIQPVETLVNLETFYCNYNQLENLAGITVAHKEKLNSFYCLPNDKLELNEIERVQKLGVFCRKG